MIHQTLYKRFQCWYITLLCSRNVAFRVLTVLSLALSSCSYKLCAVHGTVVVRQPRQHQLTVPQAELIVAELEQELEWVQNPAVVSENQRGKYYL